jgi:hypothetical protein
LPVDAGKAAPGKLVENLEKYYGFSENLVRWSFVDNFGGNVDKLKYS